MSIKARFLALLLPAIIFFPGHVFADDAAPLTVTTPVSSSPAGTIKIDDKKLIADARQMTAKAGQSVDADPLQSEDAKVKPVSANPATEEKTAPAPSTAQAKPSAAVAPDAAHEASKQGVTAGNVPDPASDDSAATDPAAPSSFVKDDTAMVVSSPDAPAVGTSVQPVTSAIAGLSNLKAAEGGGLLAPVARDVQYFSITVRKHFQQWLSRSGKYMTLMKSILRENYMPEDLVFLALIESGFNPKAYSYCPGVRTLAVHKRHGCQVWIKSRPVGGRAARPGKIHRSGGGIFKGPVRHVRFVAAGNGLL